MKKRVVAVVVVLIGLTAAGIWYRTWRSRHLEDRTLQLFGNVDIREVSLGFRVSGRLKEVLKDEGDSVKVGETMARLDDEPYRRDEEESRSQLGSLQARLGLLQAGNRPQEIAQARAVVNERQVTAANTERIYKRQEELLASKAVAVQERDDAEAAFREAEARLKSAREQLNLLEAGFRA